MCDYSRMITEYIRISMGLGELGGICFLSGLAGGFVSWFVRKGR